MKTKVAFLSSLILLSVATSFANSENSQKKKYEYAPVLRAATAKLLIMRTDKVRVGDKFENKESIACKGEIATNVYDQRNNETIPGVPTFNCNVKVDGRDLIVSVGSSLSISKNEDQRFEHVFPIGTEAKILISFLYVHPTTWNEALPPMQDTNLSNSGTFDVNSRKMLAVVSPYPMNPDWCKATPNDTIECKDHNGTLQPLTTFYAIISIEDSL